MNAKRDVEWMCKGLLGFLSLDVSACFIDCCFSVLVRLICWTFLTGLFATSGYSGKASGRFFGGFGGDFPVVFV